MILLSQCRETEASIEKQLARGRRAQTILLRVPPRWQGNRVEQRNQKQIQLLYGNLNL